MLAESVPASRIQVLSQKITKRVVDAARPGEKDRFLWDSELKGFGLKVTPKGKKIYLVQFRLPGSTTKRFTIGQHGSPLTPDLARTEAQSILGLVAKGEDPSEAKRKAKSDINVAQLCERYLQEGTRTKTASTLGMDRSRLNSHVLPLLGSKRVSYVSKSDIDRMMRDIAQGKTSKDVKTKARGRSRVTGGEGVANRTLGMLGGIFEFAIQEGLRSDNPTRGVKKFKEKRLNRFLSNDELARLGEALRQSETEGVNAFAIAAIRLLLLTGCRKNEILSLRWSEVDVGQGFLHLEDSKTGARSVPIGAPARALLSELPRIEGNPHVICGEGAKHYIGLQKVWTAIRAKAGLDDVRLHDLRHSFASMGARSGESLLVIGKVLGHATPNATGRYAHLSDDPVRTASEAISKQTASLLQVGKNQA